METRSSLHGDLKDILAQQQEPVAEPVAAFALVEPSGHPSPSTPMLGCMEPWVDKVIAVAAAFTAATAVTTAAAFTAVTTATADKVTAAAFVRGSKDFCNLSVSFRVMEVRWRQGGEEVGKRGRCVCVWGAASFARSTRRGGHREGCC